MCNVVIAAGFMQAGAAFDDPKVSPVIRQTLLHWGYELTEVDYLAWLHRTGNG